MLGSSQLHRKLIRSGKGNFGLSQGKGKGKTIWEVRLVELEESQVTKKREQE